VAGCIIDNRGLLKEELVRMAESKGIATTVEEDVVVEGYAGAAKGMFQVLWERGWIDPDNIKKYKKAPGKNDEVDDSGRATGEEKGYIMKELLADCEDFKTELTALEDLSQKLTTAFYDITLTFTPKYHCEIAGKGIELCWGLIKKYYRRNFLAQQKKNDFEACVYESFEQITPDLCRKFDNRIFRYLTAYKHYEDKTDEQSYKLIEKFVNKSFKTHRSSLDAETGYIDELLRELTVNINVNA